MASNFYLPDFSLLNIDIASMLHHTWMFTFSPKCHCVHVCIHVNVWKGVPVHTDTGGQSQVLSLGLLSTSFEEDILIGLRLSRSSQLAVYCVSTSSVLELWGFTRNFMSTMTMKVQRSLHLPGNSSTNWTIPEPSGLNLHRKGASGIWQIHREQWQNSLDKCWSGRKLSFRWLYQLNNNLFTTHPSVYSHSTCKILKIHHILGH